MTLADPSPTPESQDASDSYAHRFGVSPPGLYREALEEIERILRKGNGADDQRRVHRETGMDGLLDYLAERTRR